MFGLEARIIEIERRLRKALQDIADLLGRMAAAENQKLSPIGGASGGDGGASGVFYADGLSIAALSSATGLTVYQSWNPGTTDSTSAKVWNSLPDGCDSTKRQLMVKNPDNSYTVVSQSCSNHP